MGEKQLSARPFEHSTALSNPLLVACHSRRESAKARQLYLNKLTDNYPTDNQPENPETPGMMAQIPCGNDKLLRRRMGEKQLSARPFEHSTALSNPLLVACHSRRESAKARQLYLNKLTDNYSTDNQPENPETPGMTSQIPFGLWFTHKSAICSVSI